ncbi:MAG: RIP metalloprotease RseP [Bacteroidota bacterium]
MQALTMTFYAVLTLGILVFIHELGHFLAAKLMGMKVDRFSLGFPPRAFGKKIGDTDYCISWIPIGGYVKIAGMVDESFDTEYLKNEPQPWEFRSKPLAARVLVISAGVLMNVLLALLIFWYVHYSQGKQINLTTTVGYVVDSSAAKIAGIMPGDKIISINGKKISYWEEILNTIYLENIGNDITIRAEHNGIEKEYFIPRKNISDTQPQLLGMLGGPLVPMVYSLEPGKPAEKFGLQTGDYIIALNDTTVTLDLNVIKIIQSHANTPVKITWKRGDAVQSGMITPNESGRIGIRIQNKYTGPSKHIDYSIVQAFPEGLNEVIQAPVLFFVSIKQIIVGKLAFKDSFGGPIKIAQYATESASYGLLSYIYFLANLSMALATINILPFPALDGGHLTIMLIESIFRKEIPNRAKIIIQQAGFLLILALMAVVIYNDIVHF